MGSVYGGTSLLTRQFVQEVDELVYLRSRSARFQSASVGRLISRTTHALFEVSPRMERANR